MVEGSVVEDVGSCLVAVIGHVANLVPLEFLQSVEKRLNRTCEPLLQTLFS